MEITTKFNIWDTAFLLENRECYRVVVKEIDVEIADETFDINYVVDKIIPKGLLKEDSELVEREEKVLFLSKQEVKDTLKEIEEANEKAEQLNDEFPENRSVCGMDWATFGNGWMTTAGTCIASNY